MKLTTQKFIYLLQHDINGNVPWYLVERSLNNNLNLVKKFKRINNFPVNSELINPKQTILDRVKIEVVNAKNVNKYLIDNHKYSKLVAIDCEFYGSNHKRYGNVSLISLAFTDNKIVLVNKLKDKLPTNIYKMLKSQNIKKVFCASKNDINKIKKSFKNAKDLEVKNFVDIQTINWNLTDRLEDPIPKSLSGLSELFLNWKLSKNKYGAFDGDTLTNGQKLYAGVDAYATLQIYVKTRGKQSFPL